MAKMVDTKRPIDIYLSIDLDILHNLMLGVFSPLSLNSDQNQVAFIFFWK